MEVFKAVEERIKIILKFLQLLAQIYSLLREICDINLKKLPSKQSYLYNHRLFSVSVSCHLQKLFELFGTYFIAKPFIDRCAHFR